jgi:tRNA pseudouridine32 synthase / 23S rRNA pseudouridine746 synthase
VSQQGAPSELWLFVPQPRPEALPELFPDPFAEAAPHALARRAADELLARLRTSLAAADLSRAALDAAEGGKMFGVLVVRRADGQIGYLAGFSGTLAGCWDLPGFVPPLFERSARAAIEPAGEASLMHLLRQAVELESLPERATLEGRRGLLEQRLARERAELQAQSRANRQRRRARRAELAASGAAGSEHGEELHRLDQQSRADKAARRRLEAAHERARRDLLSQGGGLELRLEALNERRRSLSARLMQEIHDTYVLRNARGQRRRLRELFAPAEPPSGAGDCAAPKLLARAHALGLQPLALAELWWGAPPAAGGRSAGRFYPACKGKCGPLLPFLLEGLALEPPWQPGPQDATDEGLRVIYEDEWLIVVDKPAGLLSVPGRDARVSDSVLARLRQRFPAATGPLIVHRLDMDTSGLLAAAKDPASCAALQRQFAERQVHKRYVAWLDGSVAGESGLVDFPMRVDLEDRPRQIRDPVHGKPALTEWRVLLREGCRTRVELFPRTGRTHQLRVHAAHPLGLGAPITGDRLYGLAAGRMLLHAEALAFTHPVTGRPLVFQSPAPF